MAIQYHLLHEGSRKINIKAPQGHFFKNKNTKYIPVTYLNFFCPLIRLPLGSEVDSATPNLRVLGSNAIHTKNETNFKNPTEFLISGIFEPSWSK